VAQASTCLALVLATLFFSFGMWLILSLVC
jgi:hypothetical protein